MSKLEKLIAELCPDGVEYKIADEIFHIKNGYTPSKTNLDFWSNGNIPWFRVDDIRTKGRLLSESSQHVTESAVKGKLFPQNTLIMSTTATIGEYALVKVPGLTNQQITAFWLKEAYVNQYEIKFLFYCFHDFGKWCIKNANNGSTLPIIGSSQLKKYTFPLPPLPVQCEIVRILDKFTELTAELTAELIARKQQYEYYRDSLLNLEGVAWRELDEIATDMYRGAGIKRDEVSEEGNPCVRYGEIYTKYDISFDECFSRTKVGTKTFEHGDILFAITGESVEEIAKSCVYMGHETCYAGGDIVVMKHKQNPKYIAYALSTTNAQMQKSKGKIKSKVVHSSIPALKKITIPVPSLEEQARIVNILERFDTLCNDITTGLPAEIEARKQQYEYYRGKLLAFNLK